MRNSVLRTALALALMSVTHVMLAQPAATPDAAAKFLAEAEKDLMALSIAAGRASWINATYLTDDTDAIAAEYGARTTELAVRLAKAAAKFDNVPGLTFDMRRKLHFLKQGIVLPAPEKPGAAEELNVIATRLQSQYGKGKGTLDGKPISGSFPRNL